MFEYFSDWRKKTVTVKQREVSVAASGRQTETESTVASDVDINFWTGSSRETNVNDRFVDQATGSAMFPNSVSLTTKMWFEDADGTKFHIVGVDNIAEFDEFTLVSWRREYGQ